MNTEDTAASKIIRRGLICLAVAGLVFGGWLFLAPAGFGWPNDPFTSAAWKAAPEYERYRYARDLIESRSLLGKDLRSISNDLGKPGFVAPDGSYATFIVRNAASKGFLIPGLVVLQIDFSDGKAQRSFLRSI